MPEEPKSPYKVLAGPITVAGEPSKVDGDPIELTAMDAAPLLALGAIEPQSEPIVPLAPSTANPQSFAEALTTDREAELKIELQMLFDSEGWEAIKERAEQYGIQKPITGWKAAIPLIIQAELEKEQVGAIPADFDTQSTVVLDGVNIVDGEPADR